MLLRLGRRFPALRQHPRVEPTIELSVSPGQPDERVLGVGNRLFERTLKPANEALVNGKRLEGAGAR